jgi:hypothetical protein
LVQTTSPAKPAVQTKGISVLVTIKIRPTEQQCVVQITKLEQQPMVEIRGRIRPTIKTGRSGIQPARCAAGQERVSNVNKRQLLRGQAANTGLDPPQLASGERVCGKNKRQLRRENKAKRIKAQERQVEPTYHCIRINPLDAP